jgi:hypothetical protein
MQEKIEEARREFNAILDYVLQGAMEREIHEVEDGIYRMLLRLGRILLELFVLAMGTGKLGQTLVASDGSTYRYTGTCARRYLSIFGEITILRAHYAGRGRAGLFPLDARLNLPERKYSYVLQDWMSCKATESSFESVSAWLKRHLDLKVAHRPVQRVVRDCTEAVEEFMESLPTPPPEKEGSLLVHTVDCKGIPMRLADRNQAAANTGDKPGEKRMACVARGYSIDPHVRSHEAIVESFFKQSGSGTEKKKQSHRPKPRHRRTVASLKHAKSEVFDQSERAVKSRIHEGTKERVVLMDGERALWNLSSERFPDWTEIIDFSHVMEKLWIAGHLHYGKEQDHAEEYVRERALLLLEGEVDLVIEDLLVALEDGTLSPTKAAELKSKVVGYFRNNRHRMDYADYLAKGLPIATGIVESTCKTLINRRMEGSGMLWSLDGAEAMLKLRGVFLDELWDDFWTFRTQREKKRLYASYAGITQEEQQNPKLKAAA